MGSDSKKIEGGPEGDLFVLGDWKTPYHANKQGPDDPEGGFVYIYEFNVQHSTIRLHGSPEDYVLIPTDEPHGTGIALLKEGYIDLVAWVSGIGASELDFNNARQFWFMQGVEMEPSVEDGLQFGGKGVDGIHVSTVDDDGNLYTFQDRPVYVVQKLDPDMNIIWRQSYDFKDGERLFHRMIVDGGYLYASGFFEDNQVKGMGGLNANVLKIDKETGELVDELIIWNDPKFHSTAWNLTKDNAGNLYVSGGTGKKSVMWDFFPLLDGKITMEKIFNALLGFVRFFTTEDVLLPAVSPFVAKVRMSDMSLQWVDVVTEEEDQYNPFNYKFSVECLGGIVFVPDGSGVPGRGYVYNSGYAALGSYFGKDYYAWDNFTLKHDPEGNIVWGKGWGARDVGDTAWDMAADGEGHYYVVGATHGPINGEPFHGDADGYIVKYDRDHNPVWTRLIGAGGSDEIHGCAVHEGALYFYGWTMSDLAGPNAGWYDLFVGKMDKDGNLLGLTQFGSEQIDFTYNGFDIDRQNGRIYVAGCTEGSLAGPNQGSIDAFILALDAETLEFVDLANGDQGPGDEIPEPEPCTPEEQGGGEGRVRCGQGLGARLGWRRTIERGGRAL